MEIRTILTLIYMVTACNPEVETGDVLTEFTASAESVPADGQSAIDFTVRLSDEASTDRRNILFKTSGGSFAGKKEQTVKATYVNGELVAKATLKAPIAAGDFVVTAEPEFDSPVSDFKVEKTIPTTLSTPSQIKWETSGTGIAANAGSEVKLSGVLLNSSGKWVSQNTPVIFEDLVGTNAAGGIFRNASTLSSDSSTVSAYYTAGALPPSTVITIRAKTQDGTVLPGNVQLVVTQ